MNYKVKHMICPICHSNAIKLNSLRLLNLIDSSTYHCKKCGLYFREPLPDAKTINEYYSSRYFRYSDNIERNMAEVQSKFIIDGLKKIKIEPHKINYLEFGAGRGWVLSYLKRSGFLNSGMGFDSDPVSTQWGEENLKVDLKAGFLCEDLVKEIGIHRSEINFISLIHLLEHLDNPNKIINIFQAYLHEHYLFLEVPDAEYEGPVMEVDTFPSSSMGQHFWSFSELSLRILLENNNYEILFLERVGNPHYWDSRIDYLFIWKDYFKDREIMFECGIFSLRNICISDFTMCVRISLMYLTNFFKKRIPD